MRAQKRGLRRLTLPRPRLVSVLALIDSVERSDAKARREAMPGLDGRLADAVAKDMAAYMGEVMSSVARRGGAPKSRGVRTRQVLTRFGWTEVRHPYRVGNPEGTDVFRAFGVVRKMTPAASSAVTRLAVTLGSFAEASDTLALLGCGRVSASKVRSETLAVGKARLAEQREPEADVRSCADAQTKVPEGGRRVPRTLVAMADGTNVPCTKADTRGVPGRNGGEAGSRQLRVMCFSEHAAVTKRGAPVPAGGSFSYAVMRGDAAELTGTLKVQGVSRGSGTVPRMQCVADGEEALEQAFRDAFPFAEFTNDFMHASAYLSACCRGLGIEDPEREYRTCRAVMLRHGAGSAVDRIRRLYADRLERSEEARDALAYLDKRRDNMRYGWLRKNGFYISSAHAEAAARILVARRCKQAGMHWRHENAARVCAIIAKLRSVA